MRVSGCDCTAVQQCFARMHVLRAPTIPILVYVFACSYEVTPIYIWHVAATDLDDGYHTTSHSPSDGCSASPASPSGSDHTVTLAVTAAPLDLMGPSPCAFDWDAC